MHRDELPSPIVDGATSHGKNAPWLKKPVRPCVPHRSTLFHNPPPTLPDDGILKSVAKKRAFVHNPRPGVGAHRREGLYDPGSRVHSRPLIQPRSHILLSLLLTGSFSFGQTPPDTSAIGGLEVMTPYAEGYNSVASEATDAAAVRSAEDSAHFIPSHALYGEFDTDVIFERSSRPGNDSTVLELSTAACDHFFPVCGELNSAFGPRHRRMHYGIDIDLERGDPVVCAFEGVVRVSRFHKQFGHVVVVRHSNGLETLYGHLSKRSVEPGDHVEAGDTLGLGGSTGRSTGDHLHFETRYLGKPIDPQLLFDVREGELRTSTLHVHPGLFTAVARAKAAARSGQYTVRRGDTLSSIARRHRTSVAALCKLNRIRSGSKLRIGQRLRY